MGNQVLTGVSGSFKARHKCAEAELHEHTWSVMAWFETPCRADARLYKATLANLLAGWDGGVLPEYAEWAEDMARTIGKLVNCVEVIVSREAEGLYARWLV
jgi:hypothetical protein